MVGLSFSLMGENLNFTPYGLFSVQGSTQESEKKADFNWARLGFVLESNFSESIKTKAVLEYDFSSDKVKYAYIGFSKNFTENLGFEFSGGQLLSPVQYTYPGPKAIPLTRWPDGSDYFTAYQEGICVKFYGKRWSVRISNWSDSGVDGTTVMVNYKNLFVYHDDSEGYGVVIDSPWGTRAFDSRIGYADSKERGETFFVQNESKLGEKLSLWVQVEYSESLDYLSGLTYTYKHNSFLKLFWDSRTDSLEARVTYTF